MNPQTTFDFAPPSPRARRRDPATSLDAARAAAGIAKDHRTRIKATITTAGPRGACAREIERRTGLTVVQINRRVLEIEGVERRLRTNATAPNQFEKREGCAVWYAL